VGGLGFLLFVQPLGKEGDIVRTLFFHIGDDPLQEIFGNVHVAMNVAEGHLGLYHPELGKVARGVAVLCAERWAERIDLAQRQGGKLGLQLPADGEVGLLAKEIL
jgi:hypothetical protein